MDAHYTFETDRSRSLVRITMSGLFSLADIDGFTRDRAKAHAELGCAPNRHLTLNDMRGMKIQHQEVVAAFQRLLAAPEYRSRRLAFVVSPTLAKSQLMRALSGREAQCFSDVTSAERWLFAEGAESAPIRRVG